ncbi:hypothetical protein Vadar_015158 [Vaccinium darrowii]|uniref:Uncharacterized protein n=1 Tax=Vaccinium darrowii TaxID=229202 RepID=A0ACB7XAH2_9ERIC|nr:hypothetical protein Vadar_015158 [Vaccinium darrowii]
MSEALALAEVVNYAEELSDSDLVSLLEPAVEHWGDGGVRVPHRTDRRVQGLFPLPVTAVVPSTRIVVAN